ncbi:MAG: hypothetical protein H0V09_10950 [Gemmatimonadetes bacterium]|nr:hypothetical protein [Gemmatimonadota bacterium]
MSRFEQRRVVARTPAGEEVEVPCVWVPRSGRRVLAIWRREGVPAGSHVVSEGVTYRVRIVSPLNETTDRATLEEVGAPRME